MGADLDFEPARPSPPRHLPFEFENELAFKVGCEGPAVRSVLISNRVVQVRKLRRIDQVTQRHPDRIREHVQPVEMNCGNQLAQPRSFFACTKVSSSP
jgi:hypothetical protein